MRPDLVPQGFAQSHLLKTFLALESAKAIGPSERKLLLQWFDGLSDLSNYTKAQLDKLRVKSAKI
jgi:hypothetical protein